MSAAQRKIRVLVAKPGIDGHDRGAKVVARFLQDSGMHVVYTGTRQTPQMIVSAAVREEADVVGLSFLNGSHALFCPPVVSLLRESGLRDCLVIVGGIIPPEDVRGLEEHGVSKVFPPAATVCAVVEYLRANVRPRPRVREAEPVAALLA
jgi:methylmalonyl-CoA mutase C-terminal domain/subunit